eukprot:CAMPEP_0115012808 /NCGR_PEP_ID=MMETSP0216-20121206/24976_1 /TAXON_ID=223996 /ORGANISM="Protocruzia adherens, Strain Boccale" /LENGTH=609 /DNA_ID=CAMNT_0002381973 /DNA_START=154 /DNA_END=1983 /DNA_ORIENTATION=-
MYRKEVVALFRGVERVISHLPKADIRLSQLMSLEAARKSHEEMKKMFASSEEFATEDTLKMSYKSIPLRQMERLSTGRESFDFLQASSVPRETVETISSSSASTPITEESQDGKKIVPEVSQEETEYVLSAPRADSEVKFRVEEVDPAELDELKQKKRLNLKAEKVPDGAFSRALGFGMLGVGLLGGAVTQAFKSATGLSESNSQLSGVAKYVITEGNADRIFKTLSRMRGAALKIGQIFSYQEDKLIPPILKDALEKAKMEASIMPERQLFQVLRAELGDDWESRFEEFDTNPIAAASIGQVHKAKLKTGQIVAMKIQYPGVSKSIDSDIKNLKLLMKMTRIMPKGLYVDNILKQVRGELKEECDYLLEADKQRRFREYVLQEFDDVYVPAVFDDLTTQNILTSEYMEGVMIDRLYSDKVPQNIKDTVGSNLLRVCLKEIFQWREMQTDPNPGNFFYNFDTNQLILLDFGAGRTYSKEFIQNYFYLIQGSVEDDHKMIQKMATRIGFFTGEESKPLLEVHCGAFADIGLPFRNPGEYDFGAQDVTSRVYEKIPPILKDRLTPPPPEIYSLHRKLSGAYLLAIHLKSKIRARDLYLEIYNNLKPDYSTA